MDENTQKIVIDNGSYECKAGFAEKELPKCCFGAVIGRPKGIMAGMTNKDFYVGDEALAKRGVLKLTYPIEFGIVKNWDDMEAIWHHLFYNELQVKPEKYPVLMSQTPTNPTANKEKTIQIFFETFNVPAFYLEYQPFLSLCAPGYSTGIVVDSGQDVSHTVPIYEGQILSYPILRINLGGGTCTQYLTSIMNELGFSFTSSAEMEIVRDMKEKLCYVALDYEEEMKKYKQSDANDKSYKLPDENEIIVIKNQRFRCPEILFKPYLINYDAPGIHELTFKSIMMSQFESRRELFKNVFISGGNTLFPGFQDRLYKELTQLAPSNVKIKVVAQSERKYQTWVGGSILSQLKCFQERFIKRSEYDESGTSIVHRQFI